MIAKIGGGFKWGNASSRTVVTESTFTAHTYTVAGYYTRSGNAYIPQYYLLVRKVSRVVNRDKKGKITYGSYSVAVDSNQSGYFETFDFTSHNVTYKTIKG
ncbi:MAG: hypothetical protein LBU04_05030 [Christensenellaceae bacterium]|nr:hypothetical protein [Christensenellaceae bacterium]